MLLKQQLRNYSELLRFSRLALENLYLEIRTGIKYFEFNCSFTRQIPGLLKTIVDISA